MDAFELTGKIAVVTGGAKGLGAATAEALARAGATVAVLDVAADAARMVEDRIRIAGGNAAAMACDVADEGAVERAFAEIVKDFGSLDILVNNAGRAIRKPATEIALDEWRSVIDLNLTALFSCSRLAARHMKAPEKDGKPRGGAIVNLASIMGLSGGIFPNASYQASKGGVVNLTRALALEWAPERIRVNAVAPTFVKTDLTVPIFSNPEVLKTVMAHTPLGELPQPDDIAAAIVFLSSSAARFITGVTLPVDSGFLAR